MGPQKRKSKNNRNSNDKSNSALSFRPGEARRAFDHSTSQWLV